MDGTLTLSDSGVSRTQDVSYVANTLEGEEAFWKKSSGAESMLARVNCFFLFSSMPCSLALQLHVRTKIVKTYQGKTFPGLLVNSHAVSEQLHSYTLKLQLLHIIIVLITHNYLIAKGESLSKCLSKDIKIGSFYNTI